jgi:hypothetical protein
LLHIFIAKRGTRDDGDSMARNKMFDEIVIRPWSGKKLVISTPDRIEKILIFLFIGLFMWWDVLQNKVLDNGVEYMVTFFGNWQMQAIDLATIIFGLWHITLILLHITLIMLFLLSLRSNATNNTYDIIVGSLALFGVAIVLAGFTADYYSDTIHFFFTTMKTVTFYHIGVGIEIFAGLYWAFTK